LHSVVIAAGAAAVGKSLQELQLPKIGVEVTAIRRRNIRSPDPAPETELAIGDVVVLRGTEAELALAEARLMEG
jgi:CPA2 family monovalent cation:H+ antiporter-2